MSFNRSADDNYYLYHFTDARNLDSIRKYGLLPWCTLEKNNLPYVPGASPDSHKLDSKKGWQDYVRLSFCKHHPMGKKNTYKNSKIVILKISPKILIDRADIKGSVKITNTNAVSKDPNFSYFIIGPCLSKSEIENLNTKLRSESHCCGSYLLPLPSTPDPEHEFFNGLFNFKDEKRCFDISITRVIKIPDKSDDLDSPYKKYQAEVLIKEHVPVEYIVNLADPELFQ